MPLPRHPVRPLTRALQSVLRQTQDLGLWLPFLGVGILKIGLFVGLARVDLLPGVVLAGVFELLPHAVESLHYPEVVLRLPGVAWRVDVVLFVTLGAVVQGWAIARLTRGWTGRPLSLCPDLRRGSARITALIVLSILIAGIPFGSRLLVQLLGEKPLASIIALAAGFSAQMLLFAAPAYRVIDDLSVPRSIAASARLLGRFPVAVPLAVLILFLIHVPGLLLRDQAILAGAQRDPDWILGAVVAQMPADVCGAFLATGLAARFALSSRVRRLA